MGEIADLDAMVTADQAEKAVDPRRCEIVLGLLTKKWMIPILVELAVEPRRRKYLFVKLKVASGRLDSTVQELTRWGLIERAFIPCGRNDGPGLAITSLGRSFLATAATLSEWQSAHLTELLANDVEWRALHDDVQT